MLWPLLASISLWYSILLRCMTPDMCGIRIVCRTAVMRAVVSPQDLADKIASLNAAIDDVSAQLKAQDSVTEPATSSAIPS